MRVVSLFAGIGGFDLGAEQSGMKSVAHVEIDASCRKLLAARFPGFLVLRAISSFTHAGARS